MARSQDEGMKVGLCLLRLRLAESHSLKEKRKVLRSVTSRIRGKFNVAIAEVDDMDNWQSITLGISCVSNNARHANEVISKVVDFIQNGHTDAELLDYEVEVLHAF
jgi:hypothetical protein